MAIIPGPVQDLSADLVKTTPWIDHTKDYTETKKMAVNLSTTVSGISSTISGLKGDITLMKVEMAGLFALSVGLFKIDYTWFKLDDKGVTINGRQRFGWPWADKAKHFQLRVESRQRALFDDQKGLKKKLERLTERQTELARAQSRLRSAEGSERDAQRRLDEGRGSQQAVDRARARADLARQDVDRLQKRVERAEKSAKRLAKSASKTFTKLDALVARETAAKNLWRSNAAAATTDLNALRAALGQTALAASSTS
ncbi:hypothetical protein ABZ957_16040 [Streptomyces sp. NPDC046316]|uniref:hypothetical protein n=1 Tax=Streptomyces sp. NPDC046316 TaxID=3154494 RepID=UPI0033CDCA3A